MLNNIGGSVKSGHVLAIMGPSGAGKTTLLNMLTCENTGGMPVGNVTLNGNPLTAKYYRDHCAYVRQTDSLWPFMTTYEHVQLAVKMYASEGTNIREQTEFLINSMGLLSCMDTRAKKLSGGQRRRLSLAMAMAKSPEVLFLDEPTSGLDAAAAASIMSFLKVFAAQRNIAILCTIHQPSAAVFAGFDDTLILAEGRLAYFGPANKLKKHLNDIGHPINDGNPAEKMLELVNRDFTEDADVDSVLNAPGGMGLTVGRLEKKAMPTIARRKAGFVSQLATLSKKMVVQHSREPLQSTGRMLLLIMVSIVYAVNYLESNNLKQEFIFPRLSFLMWTVGFAPMFAITSVYSTYHDFHTIRREIKDGMYSPLAYIIAHTLVQIPIIALLALCILVPGVYGINRVPWESFGVVFILTFVTIWAFESLGESAAVIFSHTNVMVALLCFLSVYFMSFFYNGIMLRLADCPWPFKMFIYVSMHRWMIPGLTHAVFMATNYSGTAPCAVGPMCPQGFYCPESGAIQCYGQVGDQILTTMKKAYSIIDPNPDYNLIFGLLFGFVLLNKLSYIFWFTHKCTGAKLPVPPED